MVGTHTDFLVGVKGNTNLAMLHFRMLYQIFHGTDNRRYTGLVISAQERRAIREHDVLPFVLEHFRESLRGENDIFLRIEHDILAVIILHNLRLDILARSRRARIHMGDKADGGRIFHAVSRQRCHHITMVIEFHFAKPDFFQLLGQVLCQHQLSRRAGASLVVILIGLRIKAHIILKPFHQNIHA